MNTYVGVEESIHVFFTSVLDEGKWSVSFTPWLFYRWERAPGYETG
jgi:hypothetical protein